MSDTKNHSGILPLCIVIITYLVLQSGISGPLLFDDKLNLQAIIEHPEVKSVQEIIDLSVDNNAGPLGRPISLATFAIQKFTGNFEVIDLKRINLFLHLITGILIYLILLKILPRLAITSVQVSFIAALTTSLWLLHPLHVSTVLYTIQRMTQLATLFSLVSVLIFLHYYKSLQTTTKIKAFLIPSSLICIAILLAVYSKENAILLFPILWMLSTFLNQGTTTTIYYRVWVYGFFMLPFLLAIVAFTHIVITSGYQFKGFTMVDRTLTQGPVIISYIAQIIWPNSDFMSLHHDDFRLSSSLLTPISTLFSWGAIVALILSTSSRKIPSIVRFGILWFFIWHLIESTVLPLHIYFEHRNYAASIGLLLVQSYAISVGITTLSKADIPIKIASVGYCIFLGFSTYQLSKKWSDEEQLYAHWHANHPGSITTLVTYTQIVARTRGPAAALAVIENSTAEPDYSTNVTAHLYQWLYSCLDNASLNKLDEHLVLISREPGNYDHATITAVENIVVNDQQGFCTQALSDNFNKTMSNIADYAPQRVNKPWLSSIYKYHAYLLLRRDEPDLALNQFIKANSVSVSFEFLVPIIDLSIGLGYKEQAQAYIQELASQPGLTEQQQQLMFQLKRKLSN